MVFMQLLFNSLIIGSIYALVAGGFSLIYSTNRFMHFAHGSTVIVSGYFLYSMFVQLGMPFYLGAFITLFFSSLLGFMMYRLVYAPLIKKNASNVILLIASIGILIFFENLIQLIYGADVKAMGYIEVAKGMDILGAVVTPLQIVIILVSVVMFVLLWLFMKFSKLGRNMRAVADNRELASIAGINERRIADYSFLIGSFLAGIAGILISLEQNLFPIMSTNLIIKGFTGAVIGGLNFVPGAILGSYILGIAENFGIWYLPSGYKDAIAFGLLKLIFP